MACDYFIFLTVTPFMIVSHLGTVNLSNVQTATALDPANYLALDPENCKLDEWVLGCEQTIFNIYG